MQPFVQHHSPRSAAYRARAAPPNVLYGQRQIDAANKKRFGPFAYWFAAARKLTDIIAYRVTLITNSRRETIDAYGLAVANGRYLGGGFRIAPQAMLDDGLMDVVLFPVQTSLELLSAGIDTLLNRQEQSDSIVFRQTARVEIAAMPYPHLKAARDKLVREGLGKERAAEVEAMTARLDALDAEHAAEALTQAGDA